MSGCLPKPYKLGWHIPAFIPGSQPCVLQTFNETKSKLVASGVLFVSKDVGMQTNSITIQWVLGPSIPNATPGGFDQSVTLIVNGSLQYGPFIQTYHPAIIDPPAAEYWTGGVVPLFRAALTADPLCPVYIPSVYHFDFGGHVYNYTNDPDHINNGAGPTNMVNGSGAPTDTSSIRTGPLYSLVHVLSSEKTTADGSMNMVKQTRYFNGALWKPLDPVADPCAYLGSPCYGSPACYGSPRADF